MKVYSIRHDEDWPYSYDILARHKWGLPGLRCPECGTRVWVVPAYPTLQLPEGLDPKPYLESRPVKPERMAELRAPLLRGWGQTIPLPPGTEFGPLIGKASGRPGDVLWHNFSMLLSAETVEKLRLAGISGLTLVRTELRWRSKKAPDYFEVQVQQGLRLSPLYLQRLRLTKCRACGASYRDGEAPTRLARLAEAELDNNPVLHAPSVPSHWDLLRIGNGIAIAASERFRDAALAVGLTNIKFRELPVAQMLLKP